MSAPERRKYVVRDKKGAEWIGSLVAVLEPGWTVSIAPPSRSLDQNAIFHSLCDRIANAKPEWNGVHMDADSWKQLLILSHAVATDGGGIQLVRDLEGQGLVQLRESSARMSRSRATSLIDYTMAWAASHGVET
jgi:hypothetical protein